MEILTGAIHTHGDAQETGAIPFSTADIVQEHCLSQVIDISTRQERTLDTLLESNPTPVRIVRSMSQLDELTMI